MDSSNDAPSIELLLAQRQWVARLAASLVRDANRADDLTQDALSMALARPLSSLRDLRPWLAATVRRLAQNERRSDARRRAREARAQREECSPSADETLRAAEMQHSVARAVLALDEPYRTTVLLRYLQELPVEEVARRMRAPESTVRVRTARALEELRQRLSREHGGAPALLAGLELLTHGPALPHVSSASAAARAAHVPSIPLRGLLMNAKLKTAAALCAFLLVPLALWNWLGPSIEHAVARSPLAQSSSSGRTPSAIDESSHAQEIRAAREALPAGAVLAGGVAMAPAPFVSPTSASVSGRCVRQDGRALPGIDVFAFDSARLGEESLASDVSVTNVALARTTTDSNGRFELTGLRAGVRWGLLAQGAGVAGDTRSVEPGDLGDWTLPSPLRLFGRVLDARTRAPLAGIELCAAAPQAVEMRFVARRCVTSAVDGSYELSPLAAGGRVEIRVVQEERLAFSVSIGSGSSGSTQQDILVDTDETLAGRVIDFESGKPLADVAISASLAGVVLTRTDERGEFSVRAGRGGVARADGAPDEFAGFDAARGELADSSPLARRDAPRELCFAREGWCTSRGDWADFARPQDERVRVPLLRAGRVEGQVLDVSGAPLEGARVRWSSPPPVRWLEGAWAVPGRSSWSSRTDHDGRFVLADVPWSPESLARLSIESAGAPTVQVDDASPPGADLVRRLTIHLGELARVSGRVRVNGEPHAASVSVERPDGRSVAETRADDEGYFAFDALFAGRYALQACTSDGSRQCSDAQTIDLAAGASFETEFAIRGEFAHVRGKVVRAGGGALAGIDVLAFEEDPKAAASGWRPIAGNARSDEHGLFDLCLPAETSAKFELTIFHGQTDFTLHGVVPPRDDLVFELPELVSVRLRAIERASGAPVESLQVRWTDPITHVEREYYSGQEVPAAGGKLEVPVPRGVVDLSVACPSRKLGPARVRCLGTNARDDTIEELVVELDLDARVPR